MAFAWNKSKFSPIAIDFGADSLKLLQVIPSDPPQVIAAASVDVPEHARQDPTARCAFFAEALKSLLKSQPFKGKKAICSIPAYQTLVQHLQIARIEQEDFESQISMHLRQRLNVDPSRMVVRHFEVAQIVRDGTNKQEVLCLAASKESVMRCLDIAQRAKLDVVGMTCEPLALLKAFAHLYRGADAAERTTCFIDLGAATTKVVIAHGSQMVFAKNIHAAGDHITRYRAKAANITFTEAKALRIKECSAQPDVSAPAKPVQAPVLAAAAAKGEGDAFGFALIDAQIAAEKAAASSPVSAPAPQPAPAARLAPAPEADNGDTLDCLIDELQLSIRYHQSLFPGRSVEKLVFLGGEARNTATCQRIARALRIGAQLGDPLARLLRVNQAGPASGVNLDQPQPGWAVPIGLCLEEVAE